MEVKKKLKTDNFTHDISNDTTEEIWLSFLPNEVLFYIFRMIPPLSLLAMEKINESRFSAVTRDRMALLNIDFSKYSSASIKDLSEFFTPARAAFISELNFNDCKWIGPPLLEKCVKKCKQIHTLQVRNCNLTLSAVYRIMIKLNQLSNLSWTVKLDRMYKRYKVKIMTPAGALSKLKKVYLELNGRFYTESFYVVVDAFLLSCNNLQELVVSFILDSSLEHNERCVYPGSSVGLMNKTGVLSSLDSLTVTCSSEFASSFDVYMIGILAKFLYNSKVPGKKWKKLWIDHHFFSAVVNNETIEDFDSVECLKMPFEGGSYAVQVLESVPKDSIHTLGVNHLELHETNHIIAACGRKLKYFSLNYNIQYGKISMYNLYRGAIQGAPIFIRTAGEQRPSTYMPNLFTVCCNITELNIQRTHYTDPVDSPCTAICNLKSLQRIILPSCAVKRVVEQQIKVLDHLYGLKKKPRVIANNNTEKVICHPFKDMVKSCKFVKELHLHGCFHPHTTQSTCSESTCCSDDDISAISLWEKLEYLLLENLIDLQHCNFFEEIALQCKSLKTLCIVNIGRPFACRYLPSLCSLLMNARSLSSLKIVGKSVNFGSRNVWNSISCAKNLERMCLLSDFPTIYEPPIIISSISMLSKLHTFHFFYALQSNSRDPRNAINSYFNSLVQDGNSSKDPEMRKLYVMVCAQNFRTSESHSCHFRNGSYVNEVADPVSFTT